MPINRLWQVLWIEWFRSQAVFDVSTVTVNVATIIYMAGDEARCLDHCKIIV